GFERNTFDCGLQEPAMADAHFRPRLVEFSAAERIPDFYRKRSRLVQSGANRARPFAGESGESQPFEYQSIDLHRARIHPASALVHWFLQPTCWMYPRAFRPQTSNPQYDGFGKRAIQASRIMPATFRSEQTRAFSRV